LFYPFLVILGVWAFGRDTRDATRWLVVFWLALLVVAEVFFIDDIYGGRFNRFNTTLKWWPWIQAGILLTVGAVNLGSRGLLCRYGTMASMLVLCLFSSHLAAAFVATPKPALGRLDGAAWIDADPTDRALRAHLLARPPGIALQRLEAGAFHPSPGLLMHAGKTPLLGWPEHEKLWRNRRADIDVRRAEIDRFYGAEMLDPSGWLRANQVDYVLWLKGDNALPINAFPTLREQLRADYQWTEFYTANEFRVGLWTRRR
jgi:uncharacterized membrane protein